MDRQGHTDGKHDISIAVVIPCYRVENKILEVISAIGPEITSIYVVDDACPNRSGDIVEKNSRDDRVVVIRNEINLGVGGATIIGMTEAFKNSHDIIVKIDGDGQMDPSLILDFIAPIVSGEADYTKGNRFFNPIDVSAMPFVRLFGNAILSFLSKISSGYWSIFDPTNGFIAIHSSLVGYLPIEKIHKRFFFESDLLHHLYLLRATVIDIPMVAIYGNEISNLSIKKILLEFLYCHIKNIIRRIFYTYILRDFSIASVNLFIGINFILFGAIFGLYRFYIGYAYSIINSSGSIMLSAMPILLGVQLILSFLSYDMSNQPRFTLNTMLARRRKINEMKLKIEFKGS